MALEEQNIDNNDKYGFKIIIEGNLKSNNVHFSYVTAFNKASYDVTVDNVKQYSCSAVKEIIRAFENALHRQNDTENIYHFDEEGFCTLHNALLKAQYEFDTTHGCVVTDRPDIDPEIKWKLDFSETNKLIYDALNILDKSECMNNPYCPGFDD